MEMDELKRETIKTLIKEEWDAENERLSAKKETVYLKKKPTEISMRIFKETEDYESQVMRECEAFFQKYNTYPNAIVLSPITFNRWYGVAQDSALESEVDDFLENMTFDQIKKAAKESGDIICEFKGSDDHKATLFATPKYQIYIIENDEYQDGVYQLFNGYSPSLEGGKFTYPLIDMEATGKKIREIMDEMGITPTEVQNVCGLGSLQAVYKWFGGKSVPNIDNLGILSNLLNTPIDDLVVFKNREE